jgi:hypothetical protein
MQTFELLFPLSLGSFLWARFCVHSKQQWIMDDMLFGSDIKLTNDVFHIPAIVHSSFMMFKRQPAAVKRFTKCLMKLLIHGNRSKSSSGN